MAQVITITPDGTQSEPQELNREILEGYGTEFSNIIVEDEQPEQVSMENGTRYTYGDPLSAGKWFCVQGLWVYLYPRLKSQEIGSNTSQGFLEVNANSTIKTRYYNNFSFQNFKYRGQDNIIEEDIFSTILMRNDWSPNFRESFQLASVKRGEEISTVGNYDLNNTYKYKGILLVGVDFSWVQSLQYPYGYVEIIPLMYCGSENGYCNRTQMDKVSGGNIEHQDPGYPVSLAIKDTNDAWTPSWIVPMQNEAEYLYNQGVTDKYAPMSYDELEALLPNQSGD